MPESVIITAADIKALGEAAQRAAQAFKQFADNFRLAAQAMGQMPNVAAQMRMGGGVVGGFGGPTRAPASGGGMSAAQAAIYGKLGPAAQAAWRAQYPEMFGAAAQVAGGAKSAEIDRFLAMQEITRHTSLSGPKMPRLEAEVAAAKETLKANQDAEKAAARAAAIAAKNQIGPNNWRLGGMGLLSGLFSPWIGARMMSQAFPEAGKFLGGMFGHTGGGAGGGIASGIFGAAGLGGFGVAYIGLQTASKLLTEAFTQLKGAVSRATELYVAAARSGGPMGKLGLLQMTFGAAGLPPELAERMMEYGRLGKGMKLDTMGGIMGAGGGVLGTAELQALINLGPRLQELSKALAPWAERQAELAPHLSSMGESWSVEGQKWKTTMAELANALTPVIYLLGDAADALRMFVSTFASTVHGISYVLGSFDKFTNWLASPFVSKDRYQAQQKVADEFWGIGKGDEPGRVNFGRQMGAAKNSAWENMGLITHGGIAGMGYARETAVNTRRMAESLSRIEGHWKTATPQGQGAYAPWGNIP